MLAPVARTKDWIFWLYYWRILASLYVFVSLGQSAFRHFHSQPYLTYSMYGGPFSTADWAEEFEKLGTPFGAHEELMELIDQLIEAAPEPEEESD
jgi:hypothetical protein